MCASTSSQLQVTDTALRATERMGGYRANSKSGAHNIDCGREVWGHAPEKFGILHALKCVMGASEAPFCACIKYIHTCKLVVSDQRYDVRGPS